MRQFTLEISYSQVAIFNANLDRPFNNWTEEHFHQGFCWRPGSVSFRTAAKTGLGRVSIATNQQPLLREDAILAISVPFQVADRSIEIASIMKGEMCDIEPGDYEMVYQTGRTGVTPWIDLQFIPHKIESATILKGKEFLRPAEKLLMDAEPA